ncbi:MAG: DUF2877 domain-containing protein [Rhodospirillales bacterium]|nr:DUF2877 domain-containing protein [Rhodospirillales bacterium]
MEAARAYAPRAVAISEMGTAARRVLADGMRGTVLAEFRRCFYVEDAVGELVCIGDESIGAGPLNATIRASGDYSIPTARTPVWVDGATLYVDGQASFSLTDAAVWLPDPAPSNWDGRTLSAGLKMVAEISRDIAPDDGFARLTHAGNDFNFPIGHIGKASIEKLRAWSSGKPPAEACGLVGLGPGLTPSGDDFLGGYMLALRSIGRERMADKLRDLIMPFAREKTGKISAAHLGCAGAGMGAAALHNLIGAIMAGDRPSISLGLSDVGGIGHSSGWDATAGAVCALTMTTNKTWRNVKC